MTRDRAARRFVGGVAAVVVLLLVAGRVWAAPKYVILFVGDGMGFEAVEAGRYYANGDTAPFVFETFEHQARMTHFNATGGITDSAASATAMATGVKVNNSVISQQLPGSGANLTTSLELFQAAGKSAGLVTSHTPITDATPAGFGAHEPTRDNVSQIASDLLNGSRPQILFGAPASGINATTAAAAGYSVVTNAAGLLAVDTETATRISGQFDFASANAPTLAQMTATALNVLDNDADGFFLLVEHEDTDGGAHANNIQRVVTSVAQLDAAVQSALSWASARGVLDQTLILVTADHETGGLTTTTNNGAGNLPGVSWTTTGHSHRPVPVYATGPNAAFVLGTLDNTDIFTIVNSSAPSPPPHATVTFQEGVAGYAGTLDTYIDQATPTTLRGAETKVIADGDSSSTSGNQVQQALIRFEDLFADAEGKVPAGSRILSAALTIYTGTAANDESASSMSLYRMLTGWDESSTWNTLSAGVSTNGVEASASAEGLLIPTLNGDTLVYDVTATLQAWADGAANFGWVITPNGTDGWRWNSSEAATASLRPWLEVTFALVDQAPDFVTEFPANVTGVPSPSALAAGLLLAPAITLRRRRR